MYLRVTEVFFDNRDIGLCMHETKYHYLRSNTSGTAQSKRKGSSIVASV